MMTMEHKSGINRNDQAGFGLIVVLVLFLFLGIVGGSLCSILTNATSAGLSRLNSAKAFYAAQAGLHWLLYNRTGFTGEASFGGGTISLVEKNQWRYEVKGTCGDTERRVRGYRSIEYFPGTREDKDEKVYFYVKNQTGYWIDFDGFVIEWSGATAYYAKVEITEEDEGQNRIKVFDKGWYSNRRKTSGEEVSLWFTRWVAPGETIEFRFEDFEVDRYGGNDVDMDDIPIKLYLYDGSYNYQFTVVGAYGQ